MNPSGGVGILRRVRSPRVSKGNLVSVVGRRLLERHARLSDGNACPHFRSAWGGRFDDEINASSEVYQRGYKAGTVAMANAGPNTNGSQFFIMHSDYGLPPSYTIFGRVTEGQDVINAIATSKTDGSDRPLSEVKMEKVTIE